MYEFYKKFFLLNLKDYPSIGIDLPITIILFSFTLIFMGVTIIVNYRRAKIELILRQLKRHNATNEESAVTLKSLKLNNAIYRRMLSVDGQMTKLVARAGEIKYTYEEYIAMTKKRGGKTEKTDFDKASFYIRNPDDQRTIKILENGAPTILNTILVCILILAIFVCLAFSLPGLLDVLNDFIASKQEMN